MWRVSLSIMAACWMTFALRAETRDWPQWRGPTRDGLVTAASWPAELSAGHLKQLWRVPLGTSYSGPIIVGARVFVTETTDKKQEVVRAFDRAGHQLWQVSWDGALQVPFFAAANGSWIRSTPACDGERLYVAGMRDVLVCLDVASGKELWRIDFAQQRGKPLPAFGCVCSPLVVGDYVYVQAGAAFAKVEKLTGAVVWSTLEDGGGMWGSAFSSPIEATIAGRTQLLVQTRENLAGVDPADGKVLWKQAIPAFRGMNILTPTVWGDSIFTSAYGGKSFLFRVTRDGEQWAVNQEWENKTQGYMSSPVVIGAHLYLHLRNGRFTCLELATGKELWTSKPFGQYCSLVANQDRILALDQKGDLLLLRASPEKFELLDSQHVSEETTWAHLGVSGQQLFVRELNALAVYEWK